MTRQTRYTESPTRSATVLTVTAIPLLSAVGEIGETISSLNYLPCKYSDYIDLDPLHDVDQVNNHLDIVIPDSKYYTENAFINSFSNTTASELFFINFNARSLHANLRKIEDCLIDIIAISETWACEYLIDSYGI